MTEDNKAGFMRNLSTMIRSWAGLRNLWNTGQKRDIEKEFGHPEIITTEDYWAKFDRGDVANRVVSIYPEECFKEAPMIYETEDAEENTEFERAFDALDDELHLTSVMVRADKLSGVGRFGVILLGLQDNQTLDKPVAGMPLDGAAGLPQSAPARNAFPPKPATPAKPDPAKPEPAAPAQPLPAPGLRLMYLRTFDESMVTIKTLEKDPRNPRFGQPIFYEINFFEENSTGTTQGTNTIFGPVPPASGVNATPSPADMTVSRQNLTVHWTRIVHLADNRLRDEIFGVPRLKVVFDRILDTHKVVGASAEMFYKGANLGLALTANQPAPGEPNPVIDKEGTKQELEEYYEGIKRYLVLDGMDAKSLGTQVSDPTASADVHLKLICAAIGCPMRVFLGSEQAQLASGQDMKSWNERLQKRRVDYVTPFVIRPFLDRLIQIKVLPFPKGEAKTAPPVLPGQPARPNYIIHWNPLNSSSLTEEADILVKRTQAMAQYINSGLDQLMSPMMYLTNEMKYSQEEAQAIIDDVGDVLIKTDPEAEHQMALDKIQATAAARAQTGPPAKPGGKPGAGGNRSFSKNEGDDEGSWVTIRGNPVFIEKGQTVKEAIAQRFGTGDGFRSDLAPQDEFNKFASENQKPVTEQERSVVSDYSNNVYVGMNRELRGTSTNPGDKFYTDRIPLMDSAMSKSALSENAVVYRSGTFSENDLKQGNVIQDKGFISTSTDPKEAGAFQKGKNNPNVMVAIQVPKGTHAIFPSHVLGGHHADEKEILLPRGSRFVSTGKSYLVEGKGKKTFRVHVLTMV